MTLHPGSTLWLLRHELRLYYFRMGSAGKQGARRGPSRAGLIWMALGVAGLHVFAFKLLSTLASQPAGPTQRLAIGVLCVAAFSMMLSQGLKVSVEVLFERGDLDLLLSSPLPTRSIFTVRLGAVVIGTAALYLFLLTPFAHAGLLLGQLHWLSVYPLVVGAATLAASLSMLLTLALVRVIGIRRTRVIAQILGAIVGAVMFLMTQFYAHTEGSAQQHVAAWIGTHTTPGGAFGNDSLLWLPARALEGDAVALLTIAMLGALSFAFTIHFTHGFFVRGAQQAISLVRNAAPPRGGQRYRFGRGLVATVLLKEWRLIARDPQLISQVLLQLLYLLPMCFIFVFRASVVVPGLGASLTFLCASLTTALAWLIIAAEDAPDLLRAAPARATTIAAAKLGAAVLPAFVLITPPLLWLAWRQPLAALLLALCIVGACSAAALVVRWGAAPASRDDFRRRAKGNVLNTFLELGVAMAWTGVALLALTAAQQGQLSPLALGAGAALMLVLGALMITAWLRRRPGT